MNVYMPCDIRGPVADLSPDLYRLWGRALAEQLAPRAEVVAGGDVRLSTPDFLDALVAGLVEGGARVGRLGVVPTPMVYFAARHSGAAGCAIVTASHGPPDQNGLKWSLRGRPPTEAEVAELRTFAERAPAAERAEGEARALDVDEAYVDWLRESHGRETTLRIVVDPGSGCWSGRAAPWLRRVFPGSRVTAIHDEPDGRFPLRGPDSAKPENLVALGEAVRSEGADLGLAFDGDGDRAAFVDEAGVPLTAEEATCVMLATLGEEMAGRAFVHDVKFSDRVPEFARSLGAEPLAERSGHAFIRARMQREKARLGAEVSGHFFYAELDGGDDGLFTACRLVAHLARVGEPLSALRRLCPPVHMTPDLRLSTDGESREAALDRVRAAFREFPQSAVDGVRIDFPDGWALVRASVTEPKLTFRFEGRDAESLARILRSFATRLPGLGQRLLDGK